MDNYIDLGAERKKRETVELELLACGTGYIDSITELHFNRPLTEFEEEFLLGVMVRSVAFIRKPVRHSVRDALDKFMRPTKP